MVKFTWGKPEQILVGDKLRLAHLEVGGRLPRRVQEWTTRLRCQQQRARNNKSGNHSCHWLILTCTSPTAKSFYPQHYSLPRRSHRATVGIVKRPAPPVSSMKPRIPHALSPRTGAPVCIGVAGALHGLNQDGAKPLPLILFRVQHNQRTRRTSRPSRTKRSRGDLQFPLPATQLS